MIENERRRKWTENESHNKEKDKEKANVASSFIIEEPSYVEDILCTTMAADHDEVNDASSFIHAHDMQITKSDIIDAFFTLSDALSKRFSLQWLR